MFKGEIMLFRRLHCALYNAHVLYYVGYPSKDFIEHLNKKYSIDIEDDYTDCLGVTMQANTKDRTYYIIWVKHLNDTQTLVHETLHLVYKILDDRGILLDNDNNETVAYYLSFWFQKLYSLMLKEVENVHT